VVEVLMIGKYMTNLGAKEPQDWTIEGLPGRVIVTLHNNWLPRVSDMRFVMTHHAAAIFAMELGQKIDPSSVCDEGAES
jgi:hypothetical protein